MAEYNPIAVGFLTTFACFYVLTLSAYTYLGSSSNVRTSHNITFTEDSNRLRREVAEKNNNDLWMKRITLNKCCGPNEIMNPRNQCDGQTYKLFNPSDIIEKMEFFVVDDKLHPTIINQSRIAFAYNHYSRSFMEDAIAVKWVLNDQSVSINYLFLQEDAALLELDESKTKVRKEFSTNAYCLDESNHYGGGLVAYINPCVENLCIRKCCPEGYYYNTIHNQCSSRRQIYNDFEPEFYFMTSTSTRDISYYLLVGSPTCSLPDSLEVINAKLDDPLYVQEDGYLLVNEHLKNQYYFYDNKSYCIDFFSNGISTPKINGMYCQKEANFVRQAEADLDIGGNIIDENPEHCTPYIYRGPLDPTNIADNRDRKPKRGSKRERLLPSHKALLPPKALNPPSKDLPPPKTPKAVNRQETIYLKPILPLFYILAMILL